MNKYSDKYILEQHKNHWFTSAFDSYCIARHGEDYSPKYMRGEVCHDAMGDGYCSWECRECDIYASGCPVEHCNEKEFWDEDAWAYTVPPVIKRGKA